jgi:hypothetical protein
LLSLILIVFLTAASNSTMAFNRVSLIAALLQSATATLSGTVVDENRYVIIDAQITVTNVDSGLQRELTTNKDGNFVASLLPPGHYSVVVQQNGFRKLEVRDIVLNVNQNQQLRLTLKVGEINESVIINGVSLIQTESAAVSTVVDRQFVANLPLNGRSFSTLIELTPGTVLTKTEGQYSVNGQRANANYFTVDGVSANVGVNPFVTLTQTAGGTIPAFSGLGTTSNLISIDALQEFTIQSSTYAAEFGRMPGAQVVTVSRSGTNHFHGALFEYFRNDALDANDWFANSLGLGKPALRQNDFGGVFGGPIVRDRSFFFFSYEGLRLREPRVGITAVPGINERITAPSQMQPYLKAFPLPNGRSLGNGLMEFNTSYSNPSSLNATSIRLDHAFNSKVTLFGRYNYAPSDGNQRGGDPLSQTVSLNNFTSVLFKTITMTVGSTQILSPRIINDVRANYSRNHGSNIWSLDSYGGAVPPADSVLFPPFASSADSFFDLVLEEEVGFIVGKNARNLQRQINLVDNLAITSGPHQFKMGVDWRPLAPILDTSAYLQQVNFSGVPGALTGIADFVSISGKTGKATTNVSHFSAFGQDNWRIGRRFVLNYGLRWEFNPGASITSANAPIIAVGNLKNPSSIHLAEPGTSWNTSYNNFAPRVGVTYQFSQKPGREVVLRGGFGIFYDTAGRLAGTVLGGTTSSGTSFTGVPFPLTTAQATPPAPSPSTPPYSLIPVFDLDLKQPRTYEWNVALEHSFGTNQTLTASYVGASGRNLLRLERLFQPTPGFGAVNGVTNLATSDYHAMQLQYKRRLSRGFQSIASYNWSHSIDISSADNVLNLPNTTLDPKVDRASSDFDVRHSLSAAITYDIGHLTDTRVLNYILRGWSIDSVFRTHTATPVNVLTGRRLQTAFGVLRPDLIEGVPLYIKDTEVGGGWRINRAAFSIPQQVRQGSLGRNALRGFPATQLDFALHRKFDLSESLALQFRAEFFNIFNHPNFADPKSNLSEGALFGQSTMMLGRSLGGLNSLYQIGGPRSTQLALRLEF